MSSPADISPTLYVSNPGTQGSGSGSGSGSSASANASSSTSQPSSTVSISRQASRSSVSATITATTTNPNANPFANSTATTNQQQQNTSATPERRAGGLSRRSSQATLQGANGNSGGSGNGSSGAMTGTGTGTKTPRKNVQWAASTKGEGPMNATTGTAARQQNQHQHQHGFVQYIESRQARHRDSEDQHRGEPQSHMHLLDEEGLDPKAFQTLKQALERHQSDSDDHLPPISISQSLSNNAGTQSGTHTNQGPSLPSLPSRPELRFRRSEPPRLSSLPPNPFSPNMNSNSNPFASGASSGGISNLNEIFTPTTLSPIHSDADTDEFAPERNVPGEAIIESTETHGLPQPLPASTTNNEASESGRGGGRFSIFPFRMSSMNKDKETSTSIPLASTSGGRGGAGGRISEGAFGTASAPDPEEEERRRLERRATKLVRAHARGFQFMAGFKGNKALQRLAPEDIDQDAPLPRRPTRFSRPRSHPRSARSQSRSREHARDGGGLLARFSSRESAEMVKAEDEDVEDTAVRRHTHHAPLALGSGVLSALLTLYDRPMGGTRSGFSTPGDRTPSGGSEPVSPALEHGGYFGPGKRKEKEKEERGDYFGKHAASRRHREREGAEEDEQETKARKQLQELERINTRLNAGSMLEGEKEKNAEERLSSPELTPPHPLYAQKSGTRSLQSLKTKEPFMELSRTMSGGIERIKGKTSPSRLTALPMPRVLNLGGDSLPSGARNAGGVFGSLIASTGNITGIAAPAPSRIAPNPKRPGFHLSRYSWNEEAETDEQARRRAKKAARSPAAFSTPGHSPNDSIAGIGNESGFLGASLGSGQMLALPGVSKSAPVTPAGEGPPSVTIATPASDDSPASETPLMDGGAPGIRLDSPAMAMFHGISHSSSKSLDGMTLGGGMELGHTRTQSDTNLSLTTIPTRGSVATTLTANTAATGKRKWVGILKDFPKYTQSGWTSESRSGAATPDTTSESGDHWDEKRRRWVNPNTSSEERRKRKRKKAEIFITRHVAEIMQRQEFIMKLARAFMMFGAPSHRLPAQIQATARVLDMELSCMYLPDVMLISFDDSATSTSNIKFIRQGAALSLGKLQEAYDLYWKVIHDEVGVGEASRNLDALMQQKPPYSIWQLALFGGFCSAAICVASFSGSFIDALIAYPLGVLLVFVQILSVRNELYSNVFEITITTLLSFLAAVFAGTHHFCYSAVASGSIVLILPGFLVLNGSLELSSRNIVSGAVRLCYAIMYALFLGFGLSIGGTLYESFTGRAVADPEDYTCTSSHNSGGAWYQRTPSGRWAVLTVPMFSLFLSLRNQAPWKKKEMLVTVIISCIGWTCNHFASLKFPNRNDVSSAIGAFAVGFIANLYGRFFSGNAFVVMITGILFQLPSGLGNGGLITFASQNNTTGTSTSYLSGFKTALQLISVSMGLTVGLGISLVFIFPIQSRKRAGGIFSL